jgi:hypothetical protein
VSYDPVRGARGQVNSSDGIENCVNVCGLHCQGLRAVGFPDTHEPYCGI